jgi:hypothetical protein
MVEVHFSDFEMTDRPVAGGLQMRRVETILSLSRPWRGDRLLRTANAAVAHAFSGMMAGSVWLGELDSWYVPATLIWQYRDFV